MLTILSTTWVGGKFVSVKYWGHTGGKKWVICFVKEPKRDLSLAHTGQEAPTACPKLITLTKFH